MILNLSTYRGVFAWAKISKHKIEEKTGKSFKTDSKKTKWEVC